MANIPVQQARPGFTNAIIAKWNERVPVKSFLRSFAQVATSNSKTVSIEVRRSGQKVAVDVVRGSDPNMNTSTRSTEKIFLPPAFSEAFPHTELEYYNVVFGPNVSEVAPSAMADLLNEITEKYALIQDKIERANELMISQVLSTGIVVLKNGTNIDFKRKADSLKTNAAADKWDTATANIEAQLIETGNFLRKTGRSGSMIFDMVMGDDAALAFSQNEKLLKRLDLKSVEPGMLRQDNVTAEGGVPLGYIAAGNFKFYIWGYSEFYEDPTTSVVTPYVPANEVWTIARDMEMKLAFAGVPQIQTTDMAGMREVIATRSGYVLDNYVDRGKKSHIFTLDAAPLPVPVSVDKIHTRVAV